MGAREQLSALAHNLWWSWDSEATELWNSLDPKVWRAVDHDPVLLLDQIDTDALPAETTARVAAIAGRMQAYLADPGWAASGVPGLDGVAYLSMEFGLHESIPLYSGGLGVLAGDHLRSASDLGLPLTGIGLLWRQGYFRQSIDGGEQVARYAPLDVERSAIQRVHRGGRPLDITVPIGVETCTLAVWRLDVGRVPLYLFDADNDANPAAFRALTQRLYGGDHADRIRQEVLLGLGAVRLLRALDLNPSAIHMNEGHCAFAALQAAADQLTEHDSWLAACEAIRSRFVFTTHTPVPAGHDRFGWSDVDAVLGGWRQELDLPDGAFMDLGRVDPKDLSEPLCMTVLALRLSAAANGVSKLHGAVSRKMWDDKWPIGHITNGVHSVFWVSRPTRDLFDAHLGAWRDRPWDTSLWAGVDAIPDAAIEGMRDQNRQALIDLVLARTGVALDPQRLTVGFARRFAPYKRGDLIFSDPARLEALLERGMQIVYAGKAHPRDRLGQELVARVVAFTQDPRFAGRVVLIPDYDIEVGRAITAGADVWLNNPRRPREASGTSGQKVVYNGGLNLSVLDGWWDEGYDGTNGWAIGDGREWADIAAGDAADAESLYQLLEDEVLPQWRDRKAWLARIRRNWITCAPAFSSHRMVRDYALQLYLPRAEAAAE